MLTLAGVWGIAAAADADALSSEGVAGEIMDIAVEHCRRGERQEALAMFQAMRAQLDPPPAILRLITDLEESGCTTRVAKPGNTLRLQVSGGWDSNVSQGISARTLVLGRGENAVELELDASYRPRAASFAQIASDYSLSFPAHGIAVQFALGQRVNFGASEFDLRTASAAVSRDIQVPVGSLRAQLEASDIWLGERHFQRNAGLSAQWLHAVRNGAWLATASTSRIRYLSQGQQDANTFEIGMLREWRLSPTRSVHVGASLQRDDARGARPGGDRRGYQLQAGGVLLAQGWRVRPQFDYAQWRSEDVFAPALLDVRRRNRLRQISLNAERPISQRTSLVLEWRGRSARDTVALYTYKAQVVSATLAFRF